jgi:hypothetical protein
MHLGAETFEQLRARVRSREAENFVTRIFELGDDCRSDEARCPRDENSHGEISSVSIDNETSVERREAVTLYWYGD